MKSCRDTQVLLVVLTFFVTACGEDPALKEVDSNVRPVKLISISGSSELSSTRYPAVIGAGEQVELSFLVGGIIQELAVNDSDEVTEGGLIARLDPRDFESSVASARASYTNAEEEYQRAVRLAEQDAIATSALEQRETQRDVAKAQLDSAEKALADSVLRAPFSGVAASVPVREQQTVSPGTSVATLINVSTLDATINLPASVVAQVPTAGQQSSVAVLLDAAPGREIEAQFSEANLVADATSQTYAVTFSFERPENLLVLPGMNATVVLTSGGGAPGSSVSVPLAAVQSDGNGQYVWLVDQEAMTVSRRDIEVASGIGETIAVTSGLSTGDQIVAAGGAYLAEGVQVTPWTE